MPLTDTKIKSFKPKEKPYKKADGNGLMLLVHPCGSKYWRYRYRIDGREKIAALGTYPDVSLAQARARHKELYLSVKNGHDPQAEKKQKKIQQQLDSITFNKLFDQWLTFWAPAQQKKTVANTTSRFNRYVLPDIGDLPINTIEAAHIKKVIQNAVDNNALDIAKRILQIIKQVFRYARNNDLLKENPAAELLPKDLIPKRKKNNYSRVQTYQVPKLLRDIDSYTGRELTLLAMKMLAYTFVRTNELLGAKWHEIDYEAKKWTIPGERMKMKRPHIVPLADQVIEILKRLEQYRTETDYIFPSAYTRSKKPMSNNTILKALERMGYAGIMTGHGFRGLASTLLHEMGRFDHAWIELQLAHAISNQVEASYNYAQYLDHRTKMMQEWADYLDKIKSEQ